MCRLSTLQVSEFLKVHQVIRYLWFFMFVLLSGCATQPVAPSLRPDSSDTATFAMNGRISVKHNGSRDSAGLRWVHSAHSDEMLLLNPLGQTAVRVYRTEGKATLDDGDRHYQDTDVESLMAQVLGWSLQLNALHHWVMGMAADGPALIERDALGRLAVLRQDGWEVRYLSYADERADSLPKRLELSHEGLLVLLLIDEWEWNPK